jgi:D-amino-acid oxidase
MIAAMSTPRATVVGAGIVGLAAASRLLDRGWRVTVLADGPTVESTSHLAAAVWFPTPPATASSRGGRRPSPSSPTRLGAGYPAS